MNFTKLEYKKVNEHYEIYLDDEFYCSCDTLKEVTKAVEEIEE